jgi:hypothetical protein
MRVGHIRGTAFLSAGDKLNTLRVGMKAIEHRQITFARYTKGMRNALRDETIDKQVASHDGLYFCGVHAFLSVSCL